MTKEKVLAKNGARWDEGFKSGWDSALNQVAAIAMPVLREAGEFEAQS